MLDRIARGEPPQIQGDGTQTRDFLYVTDVADAIVRAYQEPASRRRVLNIASGREVRIDRLTALLLRLTRSRARAVHLAARPGDVRRHLGDASAARGVLGFKPRVGLEEGLSRTVRWYPPSSASAGRPADDRGQAWRVDLDRVALDDRAPAGLTEPAP